MVLSWKRKECKSKVWCILIGTFLIQSALFSQSSQLAMDAEGSLVSWMSIREALEKTQNQPRPIILDFYTDWCGWCKKMMQTTYANPSLAQYINTNFYPVKFNAESKDTIEYLGQRYGPSSNSPKAAHSLAIKLLQGKLMYPTTLFLNNYGKAKNEFAFSMIAQGYLDIQKIEPILVYQLENVFRNCAFEEFETQYKRAFYDNSGLEAFDRVKWIKPSDYFKTQDSTEKKTLVFVHTQWCNACRVMYRTSFLDNSSKEEIAKRFNLVDFNPEVTEPLVYKSKTFSNPRTPQVPFHELAAVLCRNNITLPSVVVLDEKMNVLDVIPFYLNPEALKSIATYYGDNVYKSKSWADFTKSTLR